MRKFGTHINERADSIEQMRRSLVVHIIDNAGESEPFLEETFIEPEAVIAYLKKHGLPAPAALQQQGASPENKDLTDPAEFEQLLDTICRNCGTVTDPLGDAYKTPIGRLIFKTFLTTRQEIGIRTTGKFVFEHISEYDTEKIIDSIEEDYLVWIVDSEHKKMISKDTIGKYVMKFDRELENILGR